jgi:hypothetical protein
MLVDLVPSAAGFDPNGFMIDPWWRLQVDSAGRLPDVTELCDQFVRRRESADRCTSQGSRLEFVSSRKWPNFGKDREICRGDPDHVNWRLSQRPFQQSATVMTGRLYFRKTAADGDMNLFLHTPGDPARTAHDPQLVSQVDDTERGRLTEVELKLNEFTARFMDPWWAELVGSVMAGSGFEFRPRTVRERIDGRMAVVVGTYGLDGVHGLHSEIHPVMALAVWTSSEGRRDQWQVFARNWGSEGQCSIDEIRLKLPDDTLRLWLPWRAGADSARVRFVRPARAIPAFVVRGPPLRVPFRLAEPGLHDLVDGRVEIEWFGPGRPEEHHLRERMKIKDVVPNHDDEHEASKPGG